MRQRMGMAQFHTGDCSFMFAKPRLTPIKSVSVPPPELVAACLAVQIDASNHCGADCQCCIFVFWRDSTSVLQMLHGTSTRYPVFFCSEPCDQNWTAIWSSRVEICRLEMLKPTTPRRDFPPPESFLLAFGSLQRPVAKLYLVLHEE